MCICGISSRFQLLSPCAGQVAHALLTRPPLSRKSFTPGGVPLKRFVRLACVRHAASVHPEPGSNSHIKCCPAIPSPFGKVTSGLLFLGRIFMLFLNILPTSIGSPAFMRVLFLNLSRLFHCSVIKVVLVATRDNFYILPQPSALVNIFFQKNNNFIFENLKRRKRDSNPRAGHPTYTLSRGTSSAS